MDPPAAGVAASLWPDAWQDAARVAQRGGPGQHGGSPHATEVFSLRLLPFKGLSKISRKTPPLRPKQRAANDVVGKRLRLHALLVFDPASTSRAKVCVAR